MDAIIAALTWPLNALQYLSVSGDVFTFLLPTASAGIGYYVSGSFLLAYSGGAIIFLWLTYEEYQDL